jgi:hypothetical protein
MFGGYVSPQSSGEFCSQPRAAIRDAQKGRCHVEIKVKNGTPVSGPSLCQSCIWGLVLKGYRASDEMSVCRRPYIDIRVPFPVRECSSYCDKSLPSTEEMEKIAWILLTKGIDRKIGFVKIEEFRKIHGDDVNVVPE